jgi:hypothetical protein
MITLNIGYMSKHILFYRNIPEFYNMQKRSFHFYGDVTITGEWLENIGLCSALRAFLQGDLYHTTCCDTGTRFFRPHPKDRPIQSPLTTHNGMRRTYSYLDSHNVKINTHPPHTLSTITSLSLTIKCLWIHWPSWDLPNYPLLVIRGDWMRGRGAYAWFAESSA